MRTTPDYREVKKQVSKLLEEFDLSEPPINPVVICRELGLEVKFVSFAGDYEGVSGFYEPKEGAIYVNKEEYPLRQTFTIAHELGHHILHGDWARSEDYKVLWRDPNREDKEDFHEKEANAFAGHLLVPRLMLDRYLGRLSKPDLSKLFAVSVPVINNRLNLEYGV